MTIKGQMGVYIIIHKLLVACNVQKNREKSQVCYNPKLELENNLHL